MSASEAAVSASMPLGPGAVWRGCQTSGGGSQQAKYDVEVRICSVDEDGDVCGTLTIRDLTPSLPKLVTFFDGEIIGDKHDFITDKWGATAEDDEAHWARFKRDIYLRGADSSFRGDETPEERDSAMQEKRLLENVVFMRLKERCFLKTSSGDEQDLSGASFAGFYYIAVELSPAAAYPKRSRFRSPTAYGGSSLSRSFLSQSAPTYSLHDSRSSFSITSFRPAPAVLTRNDSYASVVRGSSLSRHPSQPSSGSSTPSGASTPINIRQSPSLLSLKQDDAGKAFDEDNVEEISLYSPPLDEYPPPFTPSSLPAPSGFPFDRSAAAAPSRGRAFTPAYKGLSSASSSTASRFYNPKTGYRGAWANAVMRGFYFASADPSADGGEGDADPYQELELHYVGDGCGALLEEHALETKPEYAQSSGESASRMHAERKKIAKDFERRSRYLMPKASSSFSLL